VDGAAAGDLLEAVALGLIEVAFERDLGVDEGELAAGAGGGDLLGREFGLAGFDVVDGEVDGDVFEGPFVAFGVHADGDGDAGAEGGDQELVWRGAEVFAAAG